MMDTIQDYTLSAAQCAQAIQYTHARYALHFASFAVSVTALLGILHFRIANRLRNLAPVPLIGLVLLLAALVGLPLDAIRHSVGLHFGISVQAWPSWFWDWTKEQIVGLLIATVMFRLFYIVVQRSPQRWWLYTWLAAVPIMLASVYADPWLFEPLFNKFTPLASNHPELIAPIDSVLKRAGVSISSEHFFEMDASSKTNSLNAYVSGFGPSRRVVLYDTIIQKEHGPALLSTFGHELGHYALDHIAKGIVFASALFLVNVWLAFHCIRLVVRRWGGRLGIPAVSHVASLPVFLLWMELSQFLSEPMVNAYSRAQEHAADVYSLEVTHGILPDAGQAAAQAFQIEGETDLDEPAPNRLMVLWLYSHPPTAERLRFALTYNPWAQGLTPMYVR